MNPERYRRAEHKLWESVGCTPVERTVTLQTTGTGVRVQEVGSGDPVLFLHGGPNAGTTWAPLVHHMPGVRALLVDRPGTGLSEPWPVTADNLAEFGASFVGDLLDGLELPRAAVVASSFGGHLALRSAVKSPDRITRMVQMAAPALLPEQPLPGFMKQVQNRFIRWLITTLPPMERANRNILRQIGHGASLDQGRIPQGFIDWYMDLARYTDTMRNDLRMIGDQLIPNRDRVTLDYALLARVPTPTLYLWGADDSFGDEVHARRCVEAMPNAELIMLPEAGHLPWIDFPQLVARHTQAFLQQAD